ncbi:unnamed protein product [Protopolystoma xenopodis]|uniref:Uncharacterized protein n=1 Tax=Protopolystoma xenopodis TaxID=117903 RepID=A0A448XCS7_9PLAT|nr:unnamed protein product [Protopolystoma xenopodis]
MPRGRSKPGRGETGRLGRQIQERIPGIAILTRPNEALMEDKRTRLYERRKCPADKEAEPDRPRCGNEMGICCRLNRRIRDAQTDSQTQAYLGTVEEARRAVRASRGLIVSATAGNDVKSALTNEMAHRLPHPRLVHTQRQPNRQASNAGEIFFSDPPTVLVTDWAPTQAPYSKYGALRRQLLKRLRSKASLKVE